MSTALPAPTPNQSDFSTILTHLQLRQNVAAKGYEAPREVQSEAIPRIASNDRDLLINAPTGTGKTATYLLGILETILPGPSELLQQNQPLAVVVLPTWELATQQFEEAQSFIKDTGVRAGLLIGFNDRDGDINLVNTGSCPELLIGTPGRILSLAEDQYLDLSKVKTVVLDEYDWLLEPNDQKEALWAQVRKLCRRCGTERRLVGISATHDDAIEEILDRMMPEREHHQLGSYGPAETLTHIAYKVDSSAEKFGILDHLLKTNSIERGMVFANSYIRALEITKIFHSAGYSKDDVFLIGRDDGLPGNSLEFMQRFRRGEGRITVATDIAGRGIDVSGLGHVINFDMPHREIHYIHRVGRAGRAELEGTAINLLNDYDVSRNPLGIASKKYGFEVVYLPKPEIDDKRARLYQSTSL